MKKILASFAALTLLVTACGPKFEVSSQSYIQQEPEEGSTRPILEMNSVLDENLYFKIKYDPEVWEVLDTPGRYMTNLVLSHKSYSKETCVILPGTQGFELEKDYQVEQWQYRSEHTHGIEYQFINPITGITEFWVYEDESNGQGFPKTLFELQIPQDGQDQGQCRDDFHQVVGTYQFSYYSGTAEELESKLEELEELDEMNKALEELQTQE